ncbi:hypothetical protein PIB30_044803 [Stylosanthes scabra]|uniref:Uncharacterized protein n=1 Tax=Stylosanthes scabra TaxID=79078 RepID=A0ABU6UF91_9FABA|nr:hypothetical protein [Stylosanthes scabra]
MFSHLQDSRSKHSRLFVRPWDSREHHAFRASEEKLKYEKNPRGGISNEKGTRDAPTPSKGKKKEPDEGSTQKKRTLKCLSFDGLLGKLKVLKDVLCRNKSMDAHLVKNNSKWK